jgi:hypothetical protein
LGQVGLTQAQQAAVPKRNGAGGLRGSSAIAGRSKGDGELRALAGRLFAGRVDVAVDRLTAADFRTVAAAHAHVRWIAQTWCIDNAAVTAVARALKGGVRGRAALHRGRPRRRRA